MTLAVFGGRAEVLVCVAEFDVRGIVAGNRDDLRFRDAHRTQTYCLGSFELAHVHFVAGGACEGEVVSRKAFGEGGYRARQFGYLRVECLNRFDNWSDEAGIIESERPIRRQRSGRMVDTSCGNTCCTFCAIKPSCSPCDN